MALRCGDDTAARAGHLSLNPFRQMGLTSLIALLLVGIAWGAVPVDPRRLRSRGAAAAVSCAGPAANLLLAALGAALFVALTRFDLLGGADGSTAHFFRLAGLANAVLFIFNLLPVPMFDGWSIFSLLFPAMQNVGAATAQNISSLCLLALFTTRASAWIWSYGTELADLLQRGWVRCFALFGPGAA